MRTDQHDGEPPWTFARLADVGHDLLDRVDGGHPQRFEVRTDRITDASHYPYVHGLTQHALRLGRLVIELYERDLRIEAMPTVRLLFECAVTASWLADSREGSAAVYNRGEVSRRLLLDSMAKSGNAVFAQSADDVDLDDNFEQLETIADRQARYFEQRCNDLEGGPELYAYYRGLCAFGHPSLWVVDYYLQPDDTAPAKVRLLTQATAQRSDNAFLHLAITSMMWAAQARDTMKVGRPDRDYLRGIARRLEVRPDHLRLTQAAVAAERQAAQDRRRAARKGPKPKRRPAGA